MPTFARLVAAVLFAVLAAVVSEVAKDLFPPERQMKFFTEFNAAVGFILGWRVAGGRAGIGYSEAIGYGITASVAIFGCALFLQCCYEMLRLALRKQYDTAPEAVVGVFELMLENAQTASSIQVWGLTIGGGIVAGLITEFTSRRVD